MFDPGRLTALLVAVSFAAGLNLYVTIAVLGLLSRFHALQLPAGLSVLDHTWVIALAIGLSVIEASPTRFPTSTWSGTLSTRSFACRRRRSLLTRRPINCRRRSTRW